MEEFIEFLSETNYLGDIKTIPGHYSKDRCFNLGIKDYVTVYPWKINNRLCEEGLSGYSTIDLYSKRKNMLKKAQDNRSSENFKKNVLERYFKGYKYVQEFIFLIEDINLWKTCNKDIQDKKLLCKNYVSSDFYFPSLNLIIELDGSIWHDYHKDKARDEYLKKVYPGLRIYRIINFNNSEEMIIKIKKDLDNLINSSITPLHISFENLALDYYIKTKYELLKEAFEKWFNNAKNSKVVNEVDYEYYYMINDKSKEIPRMMKKYKMKYYCLKSSFENR